MDLTANYSLGKPLGTEDYDIGVPNANMDIIDAQLKARADGETALDARVDVLEGGGGSTINDHCVIIATAAQTITHNTGTKITFGATPESISGCTYSDANDEITIVKPGLYLLIGSVGWVANATGLRYTTIDKNGSSLKSAGGPSATGGFTAYSTSTIEKLILNDKITLNCTQFSGGNLDTSAGNDRTKLEVIWLCDAP